MKNEYKILVDKPVKRRNQMGDVGVDRRILLRRMWVGSTYF